MCLIVSRLSVTFFLSSSLKQNIVSYHSAEALSFTWLLGASHYYQSYKSKTIIYLYLAKQIITPTLNDFSLHLTLIFESYNEVETIHATLT